MCFQNLYSPTTVCGSKEKSTKPKKNNNKNIYKIRHQTSSCHKFHYFRLQKLMVWRTRTPLFMWTRAFTLSITRCYFSTTSVNWKKAKHWLFAVWCAVSGWSDELEYVTVVAQLFLASTSMLSITRSRLRDLNINMLFSTISYFSTSVRYSIWGKNRL